MDVTLEMSEFIHGEAGGIDTFHIVGSGLWSLWGITLKVYEYGIFKVLVIYILHNA